LPDKEKTGKTEAIGRTSLSIDRQSVLLSVVYLFISGQTLMNLELCFSFFSLFLSKDLLKEEK
jgi:hypothetical protein